MPLGILRSTFFRRVTRTRGLALPLVILAALVTFAAPARAQNSWTETIDAGSTLATAQTTAGPGTLVKILGTLANSGDVDLYCVNVINPPAFSVQIACAGNADPSLFLFRANGQGAIMNDVCLFSAKTIPPGTVTSVGPYFLAVAPQGVMPQSVAGAIWQTGLFTGARVPDGPGGFGALFNWSGTGTPTTNQPYILSLNGTAFCASAVAARGSTWGMLKLHHR